MTTDILITRIIGSCVEPLSPSIDVIELEWHEAARKIMRKTSVAGRDVSFRLFSEGQKLQHNDLVFQNDELSLCIQIKPCNAIVLRPQTLSSMARVCYEIGNKHAPLFMDGDELLMPEDLPLFRWLESAGFAPVIESRRLNHMLRSNSHSHDAPHSHPRAPAWTERLAQRAR